VQKKEQELESVKERYELVTGSTGCLGVISFTNQHTGIRRAKDGGSSSIPILHSEAFWTRVY
jgi:hypothetical protein